MPTVDAITRFLNKTLNIKSIPDTSRNGLQIKGKKEVKVIGFAVDAVLSTFQKANKANVDLLIVHHGLKWKGVPKTTHGNKREAFLKKHKISLYGVHLPLDCHPKYGNNIQLASILSLKKTKKFGSYHGFSLGYAGTLPQAIPISKVAQKLNTALPTKSRVFSFGKKSIKTIGIVSGGGGMALEEASKKKIDCFIVGEIALHHHNAAQDLKQSMIVGGHYATETVGVKALMPLFKGKFNVKTVFIDDPKPL